MKAVIIGSFCNNKDYKDIDMICDYEFFNKFYDNYLNHCNKKSTEITGDTQQLGFVYIVKNYIDVPIEIFVVGNEDTSSYMLLQKYDDIVFENGELLPLHKIPKVDDYTNLLLKLSHRFVDNSPHFDKTRKYILSQPNWKEQYEIIKNDPIYKKRVEETYEYQIHPKLNVTKEQFFSDDGVDYIFEHDYLHKAIKLYDKPCYEYCKKENQEVMIDKELFFNQSKEIQLGCVAEEAMVLALERHQLPKHFTICWKKSFLIAMEKICTRITSGWFRQFAWENYDLIIKEYSHINYVENFKKYIKKGAEAP